MITPTTVVNIKRGEAYDVYIGRPGKELAGPFGNPILVGKRCVVCGRAHARGGTITCHEVLLERRLANDPVFRDQVRELAGKRLGCFCAPARCHGTALAAAADRLAAEAQAELHHAVLEAKP